MKSGNHSMENQNIVCHVFSFCSLLLALFENQGMILWMYLTPSMKLSQLEVVLGMETLAPGLLILLFGWHLRTSNLDDFDKKYRQRLVICEISIC